MVWYLLKHRDKLTFNFIRNNFCLFLFLNFSMSTTCRTSHFLDLSTLDHDDDDDDDDDDHDCVIVVNFLLG
jgi:hypothetical protein